MRLTPHFLAPLALALCLLAPRAGLAHKVTVFAFVDGANIVVDAFYSKSNKVNLGKITVQNAATGEEYLRATTDAAGALSFPVPAKAIAAKANLRILLVAGEGHQNETLVRASEFAALNAAAPKADKKPEGSSAKPAAPAARAARPVAAAPAEPVGPVAPALDEALLTRIVEQAVDSRMAPVKRLLMESAQQGPRPTEIIGGIGYIVGLFGVAAFVASRRKDHSGK